MTTKAREDLPSEVDRQIKQALDLTVHYGRKLETAARRLAEAAELADRTRPKHLKFTATRIERATGECLAAIAALLVETGRVEAGAVFQAAIDRREEP